MDYGHARKKKKILDSLVVLVWPQTCVSRVSLAQWDLALNWVIGVYLFLAEMNWHLIFRGIRDDLCQFLIELVLAR